MKDIIEAVSARLRSPYFGYSILAFFALNWRGIFLLSTTTGTPQERLDAFDAATSHWSLIVFPLLAGAIVAAVTPWIRYAFGILSRRPFELIDVIQLESEHKKTIKKTELEQARTTFFANKEAELIERAKRDEEVQGIENDKVKEKLMYELEELRRERDRLSHRSDDQPDASNLSEAERKLLKAASKSKTGNISKDESLSDRFIRAGSSILGQDSQRDYLMYEAALKNLVKKKLVTSVGSSGQIFELTYAGWQSADAL